MKKNTAEIGIVLLVICFQIILQTIPAQGEVNTVKDLVIQGMAYNEGLIRDIKVGYTMKIEWFSTSRIPRTAGSSGPTSGEYLWAMKGTKEYYEWKEDVNIPELPGYQRHMIMTFDGGVKRGWSAQNNRGTIESDNGESFESISTRPSQFCLIDQSRRPYSQMLNSPATQILGEEVVDGHTCMVLELEPQGVSHLGFKVWVDTTHGFRPRRIHEYIGPRLMRRYEDIVLVEVVPEVWFSLSGVMYQYEPHTGIIQGELMTKYVMRVTDVKINTGLPDSFFTDIFKSGAEVWDRNIDVKYSIE